MGLPSPPFQTAATATLTHTRSALPAPRLSSLLDFPSDYSDA